MILKSFFRLFFSSKKLPLPPHRDKSKNETHRKVRLIVRIKYYICEMNKEVKTTNVHRMRRLFPCVSFFDLSLWGSTGNFFEEKKSREKDFKVVHSYTVFNADSEYHNDFYLNCGFSDRNRSKTSQKYIL